MAGYALRYYKDYGVQDSIVRLEIYKRYPAVEYAPAPMEIGGVLSSAKLVMQGDQDDVTVPIIKTSLELSFVDAPDTEYGRFTGPWEEFYTPDATEFYIRVLINNTVEWTGYVTPDSYEEDITAFSTITVTARDNVGHLQDFMFEENGNSDGMISVRDIFDKAWELIESRMTLNIPEGGEVIWPECYGYQPCDVMLNVEAFAEKNWYEVLESVLDSFGLVLRYVGRNQFRIYPMRSMPLLDKSYASLVSVKQTLFQASGHRSLQRACKKIVDILKYETGNIYEMKFKASDYATAYLPINGNYIDTWQPSDASNWYRYGNIGMLNPFHFGKNPRGGASFANDKNIFLSVVSSPDMSKYIALQRNFMAGELMAKIAFIFDGRFYSGDYSDDYISIGSAKQQKVKLWYALECSTCVDGACGHYWYDMESNAFQPDSFFSSGNDSGNISCAEGDTIRSYSLKKGIRYKIEVTTNSRVNLKGVVRPDDILSTVMYIAEEVRSGVFEVVLTDDAPYLGIVVLPVEVEEGEEAITATATVRMIQIVEQMASAELSYGQSSSEGRYGSQSVNVEHVLRVPEGTTHMAIRFLGFTASVTEAGAVVRPSYTPIRDLINSGRAYCRISDFVISQEDAGDYQSNTVTSLYEEKYNNLISRDPALGSGPVALSAKVIKNGIYLPESGYPPAFPWNWPGDDVKTELQVLIAQQILMYNSKPNNLLTGTLVSEDDMMRLPGIWSYDGKKHILISGSLDLLTGYLEDVKLREYVEWKEIYPDQYDLMTEDGYDVLTEDGYDIIVGVNN